MVPIMVMIVPIAVTVPAPTFDVPPLMGVFPAVVASLSQFLAPTFSLLALISVAPDRFMPVEVKISSFKFGDRFQILEGLKAGDKVVTSANFLIDSESRLRGGGMGGVPGMPGMDMGEMKAKDQKGDMKMDHKKGMEGMDHGKTKH